MTRYKIAFGTIGPILTIWRSNLIFAPSVLESLANDTGASNTDRISKDATLTGSADPNATVTVTEGTTVLGTTLADTNGHWVFAPSGLADGVHTIVASETDASGYTGSASLAFTLDTTPPTTTITSQTLLNDTGASSTDRISNDGHVTLAGTVSDNNSGVGVEIFDGTTDLGAATINGNTWRFDYNLTAGSHTLAAVATDLAGNTTTTASQPTIIIDQSAPVPVITGELLGKSGAMTLTGVTGEANDRVAVYDGTTLLGTTTTASDGTWSFSVAKLSNAGSHLHGDSD